MISAYADKILETYVYSEWYSGVQTAYWAKRNKENRHRWRLQVSAEHRTLARLLYSGY